MIRKSFELGSQLGSHRRTKELLGWAKKRRRRLQREELIAYLCGKSAPARLRVAPSLTKPGAGKFSVELGTPRFVRDDSAEADLQPFKDALAVQGQLLQSVI